jgi:aryl-alcohol dehydrogenase-like predicted oxidoreductase
MRQRRFGRLGWSVSDIGYGMWGMGGWTGSEDERSLAALDRSVALGCNFFDTAFAYGDGHSEQLLGETLKRHSGQKLYVATKVPPKNLVWPAPRGVPVDENYPPDHVVRSAETSLRNLGSERIDLLQLHTWLDDYLDQDGWRDALLGLKRQGKVRAVGISVNDHDPGSALRAVESGLFDTVQVIYNVFDQTPEQRLLPLCREMGVGVLARVPFDEGGLTGTITPETTFPDGDWRHAYFAGDRKRQVWERNQRLQALLGAEAGTLPELALRFCLAHEAVSTVIPGMRRVESVEANVAVSDGRSLSPPLRAELRRHAWPRNFYA